MFIHSNRDEPVAIVRAGESAYPEFVAYYCRPGGGDAIQSAPLMEALLIGYCTFANFV
jgi:hypothetical protein